MQTTGSGKILCQNLLAHSKWTLGGSIKFHAFHCPYPPSLPPEMEISAQDLTLKFWSWLMKAGDQLPPPPHGKFGIPAFLDSASKVGHHPFLPPPSQKWKFQLKTWLWNFEVDLWKLVNSPPPPLGISDFSISGLSIKSWSPSPPPPPKWKFQLKTWLWNFEVDF